MNKQNRDKVIVLPNERVPAYIKKNKIVPVYSIGEKYKGFFIHNYQTHRTEKTEEGLFAEVTYYCSRG